MDWSALLASPDAFLTHTRTRGIPDALGQVLWRAITHVPQAALVRQDLDIALAQPPTLEDFSNAIRHLGPSTSPGATGLTYNMVRGWPPEVVAYAHNCLTQLWQADHTPAWMKWGWLCPKPKDPTVEATLMACARLHSWR